MEEAFKRLKSAGKNNVKQLMEWLKDANLLDISDEDITVEYFLDACPDTQDVALEAFKVVLGKIAEERRRNYQDLVRVLCNDLLKRAIVSALKAKKLLEEEARSQTSFRSNKSAWSEAPPEMQAIGLQKHY